MPGGVDGRHLLLIGAGPGLGEAVARRFAAGRIPGDLGRSQHRKPRQARGRPWLTPVPMIDTIAVDASDPEGLGAE